MLNRRMIWLCVAAFTLCVVGVAFAAAVKVALEPYGDEPLNPDASGKANLNYAKGKDKTEVQVNCWGLDNDTAYDVYLYGGEPAEFYWIGEFTTDEDGEGNLHVKLAGDVSGDLPVAVNNQAENLTVLLGPTP